MCILVLYKGAKMTALEAEVSSLPSGGQKTGPFSLCFIQVILHLSPADAIQFPISQSLQKGFLGTL